MGLGWGLELMQMGTQLNGGGAGRQTTGVITEGISLRPIVYGEGGFDSLGLCGASNTVP